MTTGDRMQVVIATVVTVLAFTLLWSSIASADDQPAPACPSAPAEYDGQDDVVHELRMLRREQADTCAQQHADAIASRALVRSGPAGTADDPIRVDTGQDPTPGTQTVALDRSTLDRMDLGTTSITAGLWVLAGLLVALFLGSQLIPSLRP